MIIPTLAGHLAQEVVTPEVTEHQPTRQSRRRRFAEEFGAGAVAQVIDQKRTVVGVARELGIVEQTLGNWVLGTRGNPTPVTAEVADLADLADPSDIGWRCQTLNTRIVASMTAEQTDLHLSAR